LATLHVDPASVLTKTPFSGVPANRVEGEDGLVSNALIVPPGGPIEFHVGCPWALAELESKTASTPASAVRRIVARRARAGPGSSLANNAIQVMLIGIRITLARPNCCVRSPMAGDRCGGDFATK
jgi:hypothetical protein